MDIECSDMPDRETHVSGCITNISNVALGLLVFVIMMVSRLEIKYCAEE